MTKAAKRGALRSPRYQPTRELGMGPQSERVLARSYYRSPTEVDPLFAWSDHPEADEMQDALVELAHPSSPKEIKVLEGVIAAMTAFLIGKRKRMTLKRTRLWKLMRAEREKGLSDRAAKNAVRKILGDTTSDKTLGNAFSWGEERISPDQKIIKRRNRGASKSRRRKRKPA
jgi:hypothetical protein